MLALLAERDISGEVSNARLAISKVRGAPAGKEIAFDLKVVPLGEDRDGDPVTTCIIVWREGEAAAAAPGPTEILWPKTLQCAGHST